MSESQGKSLTPRHRANEVAEASFNEGMVWGVATLIPSSAAVWYLLKVSPKFKGGTNWQSRTALAIMPALGMFALTSELKVNQKKEKMAAEQQHARELHEWHEKMNVRKPKMFPYAGGSGNQSVGKEHDTHMVELYRTSVKNSGVRIVPGDSLALYQRASNFVQEHPFKLLSIVGIPSVLYIFYGKQQQQHLQLQSQIMHTRVFGQFTVISILLSFMGFKTYMDLYGTYVTEAEMEAKVEDMRIAREIFIQSLEQSKKNDEHRQNLMKHVKEEVEKEAALKLVQDRD